MAASERKRSRSSRAAARSAARVAAAGGQGSADDGLRALPLSSGPPIGPSARRRQVAAAAASAWVHMSPAARGEEAEPPWPTSGGSTSSTSSGDGRSEHRSAQAEEQRKIHEVAAWYPPLSQCLKRLERLERKHRSRKARKWLCSIIFRLAEAPAGIVLPRKDATVRFVALSDTHRYHEAVTLPAGEVLLFAGDAVGNYGRHCDIMQHLTDFLKWLTVQSRRFKQVFFIAGNHETLLDDHQAESQLQEGKKRLRAFLAETPNCTYLDNSTATYRGLSLFGSPISVSRMETEGKRYYSRAFERMSDQRAAVWAEIPERLDLLMTHCPPRGRLCSADIGCQLLATRLSELRHPPRYHVFGHDHCFLGLDSDARTVYFNVAQDESLRVDSTGGGCALVFDMQAKDDVATQC